MSRHRLPRGGWAAVRRRLASRPQRGRHLPAMEARLFVPFVPDARARRDQFEAEGCVLSALIRPYQRRSGDVSVRLVWQLVGPEATIRHEVEAVLPPLVVFTLIPDDPR